MTTIDKLQSLYRQLDAQASAGEDVVADLRKEITNIELAYLKDEVLPEMATTLGSKIKNLRCGLDCSIQIGEDGIINYTFCTSGSMLMVKDSVDAKTCTKPVHTPTSATEHIVVSEPNVRSQGPVVKNVRVVDCSEKAIAVYGDTKQLADTFKNIGGYFNAHLKEGPGWVFSKKRRDEIEGLLAPLRSNTSLNISQASDNLLASVKVEASNAMTEDEWLNLLTNMKCMPYSGLYAPHKAIFILMIIEAIRCGVLKDNIIMPTVRLLDIYMIIWNKYVPKDWPFTQNFYQPYAHLSSEKFYDIVLVNERAKLDINMAWTSTRASRYIRYGIIDNRLFSLLGKKAFANRAIDAILNKYLNYSSRAPKVSESKPKIAISKGDSLSEFRKFLLTTTTKQGKRYAPSSINVYISSLKSDYMQSMVKPYSSDGIIESIKDLRNLEDLYDKVKQDAANGIISKSVLMGLRLYINFRSISSNITDISSILTQTSKSPSTFNSAKSKQLEIKSIQAEHILINEGNPTSMLVQFINEIGPELIEDMHIKYLGGELVSKIPNPKYVSASKNLNDGYWVNTNSSTKTKIDQIKLICTNLGIDVSIDLNDDTVTSDSLKTSSSMGRALFSLNGQLPLNKRNSVLACVRLFMSLNPNIPFEVVERNFPPELQGGYGVVAKLSKVNNRINLGYDDNRRYFLKNDQILHAKDGVAFVVCHEWGNQFYRFQEHVKKRFGWTLEEIN